MTRRFVFDSLGPTLPTVIATLALALTVLVSCDRGQTGEESADQEKPGLITSLLTPRSTTVTIPEGMTFEIALEHSLSTENNAAGDGVEARVTEPIVSDGRVIVADGARAHGIISSLEGSGRVKGRASMAIKITELETAGGDQNVEGVMVAGSLRAPGTKKRDAATIGGGAAAGAVLGEVIGDKAALGAVIGGAAGTGIVLGTKGKELELPAGTTIKFKLVNSLDVKVPIKEASNG